MTSNSVEVAVHEILPSNNKCLGNSHSHHAYGAEKNYSKGDFDKMKGDKETTTIRIPVDNLQEMQKEAKVIGISLNSYMLMAMHTGRKVLNSNITVVSDTH